MLRTLGFGLLLAAFVIGGGDSASGQAPTKYRAYFGTYTNPKGSQGIYLSEFDPATGKLSEPILAAEAVSPSFLAIHPNGKLVVAVNEISNLDGKKVGGVSSFSIDPATGKLTKLSQQPSGGGGPCHVTIDATGKYALAANYGGGSCCVHPISDDGKLGEMTGFVQHTGSGANLPRQKDPHAHSINMDATNKFAFCADLGLDKVLIYKLDQKTGKIEANDPPHVALPPGGGPRHFAFHPNGKFAYTNLEITSAVSAMAYDSAKGSLTVLQTLSTLPAEHKGNSTAEVQVHPSGKFLYVSNRGHNSIAIFQIAEDGKLTATGHQGEGVNVPRNFGIDPTGKYAIVCNQAGNDVVVFKIDQQTGKLEPTGNTIKVGAPVCVKFAK